MFPDAPLTRRSLTVGAAAAALWIQAGRIHADATSAPAGFPGGVELYRSAYRNWCGAIVVDDVWTCAPQSGEEVALLANWARTSGWKLRPRGMMHTWAPLVLGGDTAGVVLIATTEHLAGLEVVAETSTGLPGVRAQAGAQLIDVLSALKLRGLTFAGHPAIGEITMGGALAIAAHGAGVAPDEGPLPGQSFGSLSNLVVELTAVVWDASRQRYVVRRFSRGDPAIAPLLTGLGRIFVVEAVLQAAPDRELRCVSRVDIPAEEVFGATGARTLASFLADGGAVDALLFPFTDRPWLKHWSPVGPVPPVTSRRVGGPYNYPFTDQLPPELVELASRIVTGHPEKTPLFGAGMLAVLTAGLAATGTFDIRGASMDVQLWTRASSLPSDEVGYGVLCARADTQSVVARIYRYYVELRDEFQERGEYPTTMPFHVRVSGIDRRGDVGDTIPSFSPMAARPDRPEWDTVVWLNVLALPGTDSYWPFCARMEEWLLATLDTDSSVLRVEWSKGWAITEAGAWRREHFLESSIPDSFSAGRPPRERWDKAAARLGALDPAGVFATSFHTRLLG